MDDRVKCNHPECTNEPCDYPCVFCLKNMEHDTHTCRNVLITKGEHPQYFTCSRCQRHVKKNASAAMHHHTDAGQWSTKWNVFCRASRTLDGKELKFILSGTKVGTFTKEEMEWNTNI